MARTSRQSHPTVPVLSSAAYRQRLEKIVSLHRKGARGFATALRLTRLTDALIANAFHERMPDGRMAVIALGGYGRQELCFSSDMDIMVLARPDAAAADMKPFYHAILDFGLDIGHSYRTIDDCIALRETDPDAWIALLDARYVAGSRRLYHSLIKRLRGDIAGSRTADLVSRLQALSAQRHSKYGRSTKLLEPNIKNSSGGLRDAQSALWLLRVTKRHRLGTDETDPALSTMFRCPSLRAIFPRTFLREARESIDRLLRIRNEMHLRAGSLHDILEFSTQTAIAKQLGYRERGPSSSVERFMRDYYGAASSVAELHSRVSDWAADAWLHPQGRQRVERISDTIELRGSRMSLAPRVRFTTTAVLEAYAARIERSCEFSFRLEDMIHRRAGTLKPVRTKREAALFCALFAHERGVSEALRHMNRFGVLARLLPEWRPLVRFFQHNQYHYFTADEHTLTVMERAESLADERSTFGDVFRSLPRKDILFFACLFHDITKPARLDDHEHTGADLAATVLARFYRSDIAGDVAFLVRHHLMMEQVAFRRNLSDPFTIREFAGLFSRPDLLGYLYVLTYADLAAVNRNVLTEWKKALLTEAYVKTLPVLEDKDRSPLQASSVAADELIDSLPQEDADTHRSLLTDDAYRRTFSRAEIADHITALKSLDVSSTIVHHWSDVTDLTLLTHDAPYVLARVCGAIYANDLNIIDARIFTRHDGLVIDSFRIVDGLSHRPLTEEQCRTVESDIRDVLTGSCTVDELLARHRRRWKRRTVVQNPNVRFDVAFEDHPRFTIIDVFGADAAGFLYTVSDAISHLGCTIHFAKIATRADGIVDTFYVRDGDEQPITDASRREEIRSTLLHRLKRMYVDAGLSPEMTV